MKIYITFYKHALNISNGDDVQQNYISIEPLLNFLATFCIEKTGFLSIFFSNSEFGMKVYRGKIEAEYHSIFLYSFFGDISTKNQNFEKN